MDHQKSGGPPPAHNMSGPPQHPTAHNMAVSQPIPPRTMQQTPGAYMPPRPAHTGSPVPMPNKPQVTGLAALPKVNSPGSVSPKLPVSTSANQEKPPISVGPPKPATPPGAIPGNMNIPNSPSMKSAIPPLIPTSTPKQMHPGMGMQQQPTYQQMMHQQQQQRQQYQQHMQQSFQNQHQLNASQMAMQMGQHQLQQHLASQIQQVQQQYNLNAQQAKTPPPPQNNVISTKPESVTNKGPTPPVPALISINKQPPSTTQALQPTVPPKASEVADSSTASGMVSMADSIKPNQQTLNTNNISAAPSLHSVFPTMQFPLSAPIQSHPPTNTSMSTAPSVTAAPYSQTPVSVPIPPSFAEQKPPPHISITPSKPTVVTPPKPEVNKPVDPSSANTVTIIPKPSQPQSLNKPNDTLGKVTDKVPANFSPNQNGVPLYVAKSPIKPSVSPLDNKPEAAKPPPSLQPRAPSIQSPSIGPKPVSGLSPTKPTPPPVVKPPVPSQTATHPTPQLSAQSGIHPTPPTVTKPLSHTPTLIPTATLPPRPSLNAQSLPSKPSSQLQSAQRSIPPKVSLSPAAPTTTQVSKPVVPGQPIKPVQSAHPAKPIQATQPVKPVQPSSLVKPMHPSPPIKPVQNTIQAALKATIPVATIPARPAVTPVVSSTPAVPAVPVSPAAGAPSLTVQTATPSVTPPVSSNKAASAKPTVTAAATTTTPKPTVTSEQSKSTEDDLEKAETTTLAELSKAVMKEPAKLKRPIAEKVPRATPVKRQRKSKSTSKESDNEDNNEEDKAASRDKRKLSETPSEGERKSKRSRAPANVYQAPIQESEKIPKELQTPKTPAEKLVIFFKNEHAALRNADGTFFICQLAQNVYKSTRKIKIRWLSPINEEDKNCDIYKADYYDITDFDCILTSVAMSSAGKGTKRLPEKERQRIVNILDRALKRDKDGVIEKEDVDANHPDGLDLSLYNDESQLKKRKTSKSNDKKKWSEPVGGSDDGDDEDEEDEEEDMSDLYDDPNDDKNDPDATSEEEFEAAPKKAKTTRTPPTKRTPAPKKAAPIPKPAPKSTPKPTPKRKGPVVLEKPTPKAGKAKATPKAAPKPTPKGKGGRPAKKEEPVPTPKNVRKGRPAKTPAKATPKSTRKGRK